MKFLLGHKEKDLGPVNGPTPKAHDSSSGAMTPQHPSFGKGSGNSSFGKGKSASGAGDADRVHRQ